MGGRRRRLQQQLEEESIKAANLAYKVGFIFPHPSTSSSKVEQMDNKLSQREEQIVNLGKELEKQRELRLSQVQNQLSQPLRMTSFSMKLFYIVHLTHILLHTFQRVVLNIFLSYDIMVIKYNLLQH